MAFLKSSVWVTFLKEVTTGIQGSLPDPQFQGSGLHFTSRDGKLDLHSDFNTYPGPKLERRVNMFIFLDPEWKEVYGGH